MRVCGTSLPGVLLVEPAVFGDARGFFLEAYNADRYAAHGIDAVFVQDNVSLSSRGVLRGLHLQHPHSQGKLVQVLSGEVFDVAVDVRRNSPSAGQWFGVHLSDANKRQLFIPPGFAHGFVVLSEQALFAYKCTDYYAPAHEVTVRWDDPALAIAWPVADVTLSDRDRSAPTLDAIPAHQLPVYSA